MLKPYPFSKQRIGFSKIYFSFSCYRLDHHIRKVGSSCVFKNNILKFIRPTPNSVFNCENHRRINCKAACDLSHLCEHKFKHSFQDTLSTICSCGFDVESILITFFTVPCTMMKDISWIAGCDWNLLDKSAFIWKLFCWYRY